MNILSWKLPRKVVNDVNVLSLMDGQERLGCCLLFFILLQTTIV